MYYMTLVEETDNQYKTCLKFWRNTDDEIYFEMGFEDENEYPTTQAMCLDVQDCETMIAELQRIVDEIKALGVPSNDGGGYREMTPPPKPKKKKPQGETLFKFQNDLKGNLTKVS